jgi:hypothetical protein
LYHRDTVKMPVGVSRRMNASQPSTVYSPFSDSEYAPAPVEAHVSISDIVITSYCRASRVKKLRASSATSSTPGSAATPENSAIAPRCSPTILR